MPHASCGYVWAEPKGSFFATTALDYVGVSDFDPEYDEWFTVVDPGRVETSGRVPAARSHHQVAHCRKACGDPLQPAARRTSVASVLGSAWSSASTPSAS